MTRLKRFFIFAKDPDKAREVRADAELLGFVYDEKNPDFIISFGGDGTFLRSEQKWPGIPKLLVRDSLRCMKCHDEPVDDMLAKIKDGKCRVCDILKLEATCQGKKLIATNDVIIRNSDIRKGVRFKVSVDGEIIDDFIIGDGIVVATPFGSSGYFYSITRKTFSKGIGIAFNNAIKKRDPVFVNDDAEIKVDIIREKVDVAADNDPKVITGGFGDSIIIKKAKEVGRIVTHV